MRRALKWAAGIVVGLLAICGAAALVIAFAFDGAKDYTLGRLERVANQGFDAESKGAKDLLALLDHALPYPKPAGKDE